MLKHREIKRVYIAGPMSGYPDANHPAFYAMEEALREAGYEVVNPARLTDESLRSGKKMNRQDFYRQDFRELTSCDAIMLLSGWPDSHGARFERQLALEIGCRIFYEEAK